MKLSTSSGGTTIGIDPKFALDPDLEGLSEALAAGDEERLLPFARKLIERAKELAKKEYWAHIDHSPAFVLMFVPIEGVQEVLSAVPRFGYGKFALEHGVYIVTPLQLGTTLGVIAEVAHAEKRSEETEEMHRSLIDLDREIAKFCDHYAKHGRQLAATVSSYNSGAAMLSSRGGLGRMVKRMRGYSRRLFKRPNEPQFEPVRDDVEEIAQRYQKAAATPQADLRKSA
jgi:DNA recombination protein RmuC